ncbi:uncharacterized protein [Asterias amurensis]|uniref:uncharacterized protein isoform X3 n=1 Tax=Asterias amurensis TaxID=7602 RepID=UPI003AB6FF8E
MAEGEDNADFSAAVLAMIGGKRSFNRAISLAFSQAAYDASSVGDTGEDSGKVSDWEEDSKESKMGLLKVRRLLSNHVSVLVGHCFDIALAYVWWSRGKIDQAQKAFLDIVGRIPSDHEARLLPDKKQTIIFGCQKSLYLNELGRMLSQFDQPDSSVQYYRQAVDVFEETSVAFLDQQVMQSFVLCAAAYDQGLMDHSCAVKAALFWELVTADPSCPVELIQASVDSFLHCHTGFIETDKCFPGQLHNANMRNKTWLLEAGSRIEKLLLRAPHTHLHYSLIMSMLGEERRAKAAYSRYVEQFVNSDEYFRSRGTAVENVALSGFEETKPQPWWTLLEWMSTKATLAGSFIRRPIPGIPLLWRRSIRHAAYGWGPSNGVTDVKGKALILHITHDGFLSGTMLQNTPPFKSVLLDPQTGSICIPDQHRQSKALNWDNYISGRNYNTDFCVDAFLPFPILLFQNSCEDVTVTILNVGTTANLIKEKIALSSDVFHSKHANVSSTVVYSKGRDTVKVNLRELVMRERKAAILQHIKEHHACEEDQTIIKDCTALIDYCITRGLQIDYAFVERVVFKKEDEAFMETVRQKTPAGRGLKDAKCGTRKKKHQRITLPPCQALSLQDVFYVGRSTVILCLYTAAVGRWKEEHDTFVFLNCSSPESIRNPVIHCASLPRSVWKLPQQKTCWQSKDFKQDVFFAHIDTYQPFGSTMIQKRTLMVFDEFGSITQRKHLQHPGRRGHDWQGPYTGCFGHHIIGRNQGETASTIRVWNTQGSTEIVKTTPVVEDLIVTQDMVFISQPPNILVLDSITLEPLHVQTRIQGCASVTNTDGILVRDQWRFMSVLATTDCSKVSPDDGNKKIVYTRVILGAANHLLILEKQKVSSDSGTNPHLVDVVTDILIPGIPREACYISKRAGFVVAASHEDFFQDPYYRENLYWFSVSGVIQGIHPMLGKSPHCLYAVPLQTKDDTTPGEDARREKCWHLFFDDGLGALCCIKLESDEVF